MTRRKRAAARHGRRPAPATGTAPDAQAILAPAVSPCPDCGAAVDGNVLSHVESCPLAANVDATMLDDASWFAAHPGATMRRRPLAWAERDLMREVWPTEVPEGSQWRGQVVVRQLMPGLRARDFGEIRVVPPAGGQR